MSRKNRMTNHQARTNKNGKVFTRVHNDRNFDVEHARHINAEKSSGNVYFMNPEFGVHASTFEEFERLVYEKLFADHIKKVNEKAEKSRHRERMISAESMLKSPRTCLEETLIYFGDQDHPVEPALVLEMAKEFFAWRAEAFPQLKQFDFAMHVDEQGAVHIHDRSAWLAFDKDGDLIVNQTKSFSQMGFSNKGERYDNAKMQYSKMCREKQIEIARSHGIEVELTPKGKGGLEQEEFKLQKVIEKRKEQEALVVPDYAIDEMKKKVRPVPFHKDMVQLTKEDFESLVMTALLCDRYRMQLYEMSQPLRNEQKQQMMFEHNQELHNMRMVLNMKDDRIEFLKRWLESTGQMDRFEASYKFHVAQRRNEIARNQERVQQAIEEYDGPSFHGD